MEKLDLPTLVKIIESGPAGMIVGFSLLVMGFYLRNKGWLTSDKKKVVSSTQLSDLSQKVGAIDGRVSGIESDLKHRPTRQELHDHELKLARLDEQMKGLVATTKSTNHAVARIEEYMINISKRTKR